MKELCHIDSYVIKEAEDGDSNNGYKYSVYLFTDSDPVYQCDLYLDALEFCAGLKN
jgi:hypothetical protein